MVKGAWIQLSKKDFDELLKRYNIGKYKKKEHADWALGNTVYFFQTTRGWYVLKMFEERDTDFLKFEVKTMEYIEKKGIPGAKIIKNKKGGSLTLFKEKYSLIQKYVDGKAPTKKFTRKLVKDMAKNIALMDKYLMRLKMTGKHAWKKNYQFMPASKWHKGNIEMIKGIDFRYHEKKLVEDMKKIKKSKLRRSFIHSDICGSNYVTKNDKLVAFVDWDDLHEDYLMYEVAVFIGHAFVGRGEINVNQLKFFLKEYQEYFKFNEEEKKACYYFVLYRYLSGAAWLSKHAKRHGNNNNKEVKVGINYMVNAYKTLRKVQIKEFISWF
ncbi:MAG: phosphotransferase [archaeon]